VNLSENKFLGSYLVNESGFALYTYASDADANGASACYDDCAVTWKPFYAENITSPDSVNPVDFGTITRTDGSKQTTYKGWPLYLYSRDGAAGDVSGNGKENGLWHVVSSTDQSQLF
jgi:predicted lipoprotein with Yx(FWY)xxD motif